MSFFEKQFIRPALFWSVILIFISPLGFANGVSNKTPEKKTTIKTAPIKTAPVQSTQSHRTVNLTITKGRLLHLPMRARNVFLSSAKVADIQVKSPQLIFVFGKNVRDDITLCHRCE